MINLLIKIIFPKNLNVEISEEDYALSIQKGHGYYRQRKAEEKEQQEEVKGEASVVSSSQL